MLQITQYSLITQYSVLLLVILRVARGDVQCGGVVCSSAQTCCSDQESCCEKSSASTLVAIAAVLFVVCITATGLGICLYFKKRVHRDTSYTPEDIEDMFVTSLYKEMKSKVEPLPSNQTIVSRNGVMTSRNDMMTSRENMMTSRENMMTSRGGTPGMICEDIPMINPGIQHPDLAVMPSAIASSYSVPGSMGTSRDSAMMMSRDSAMMMSRDNLMASRNNSIGTFNSLDRGPMMDKMTESVETQVTSAKRTVVTVNLNMKEKENIKLNIFMNKDKEDVVKDEVESNASFPRGLTAKVARKKSAKRSSSSSGEQKGGVGKKDSLRRNSSKSPGREKPPVKEQLSSRASSAKKKRKS